MKPRTWVQALALLAVVATRVSAQGDCQVRLDDKNTVERNWQTPLDRKVALPSGQQSLHDLLERIAEQANFRISYSTDALPLERSYCVSGISAPAGRLLAAILAGVGADAVIVATDHVVLAPAARTRNVSTVTWDSVISLDSLVVLGKQQVPAARTAASMDVIDGARLAANTSTTVAQVLNGNASGMWLWQSGSGVQYGSARGASSFGINAPKVYIDGIPAANSLIATRFAPGSIARVEVFRGPEAGVQFGGDAMSGVTSIVTRHEVAGGGVPHVELRGAMGVARSDFVVGSSMTQDHALNVRVGGPALSSSVNLSVGNGGVVLPGSFVRHAAGDASIRGLRGKTMVTGTLHFFTETTGRPWLVPGIDSVVVQNNEAQSLRQYTAGVRLEHQKSDTWTHLLLAGIDGFSVGGVSDPLPFLSPADSALRSLASAHRGTFRLTSTGEFVLGDAATASLTATAEHSRLRQRGLVQEQTVPAWHPETRSSANSYTAFVASNDKTQLLQDITGLSLQTNALLYDRVSLSGGVRIERHTANGHMPQLAALPTLSAAFEHESGPVGLRARLAAGKGIRWPQDPATRPAADRVINAMPLEPEQQTAFEAGFDLSYKNALTLRVTRFDQTASKLIQRTTVPGVNRAGLHDHITRVAYRVQNLGEINNRGWEVQAALKHGPLDISTGFSTVDSRVQQVANGYTGDLRPGDRMLAVPARTLSASASWSAPHWSTSISAFRAFDWVNYDRLALNQLLTESDGEVIGGSQLRNLWRAYEGSTHVRASASRQLNEGFGLWFEVNNLLNRQAGEPDNATFAPGRSFAVGVRASF